MFRLIGSILLAILFAVVTSTMASAPAEAKWNGGSIEHHSPDDGHDDPILVSCLNDAGTDNDTFSIREGVHSDDVCPDEDVDSVYVHYDEEIWCWVSFRNAGWQRAFDKTGWHDLGNFQNKLCIVQKD